MDLDLEFLCALTMRGKLEPAIESGVTVEDFSGDYKKIYQYVLDHFANPKFKGAIPTARMLERKFHSFEYHDVSESVEWLCEQILERTSANTIADQLRSVTALLEKRDVKAAQEAFLAGAMHVAAKRGGTNYVDLTRNVEDRIQDYKNRKEGVGVYGTPSGFEPLDKRTLGFQGGEFVYVLARTGIGKTWTLIKMAKAAQDAGLRVLFLPLEMSGKAIANRYDALKHKVPYSRFRRGKLEPEEERRFVSSIRKVNGDKSFIIADDAMFEGDRITPLSLRARIRELKINAVAIDGVYMMQSDRGLSGWEKHVDVAENLKRMFRTEGCYGMLTNQLNNEADPREATIENQRYGNYGQYSDVCVKIHQGSDERQNNQMLMWILKLREEGFPHYPFTVEWNFNEMDLGSGGAGDEDEETKPETEEVTY